MKIGICGDVHYSVTSSILRRRGELYSKRLENCIQSVNWVEKTFKENNCTMEVYLGDFFSSDMLNSELITSLSEIKFNDIFKYFMCGNHEMGDCEHKFSSAKIFNLKDNCYYVDRPSVMGVNDFCEIAFLPYVMESSKKSIHDYFGDKFRQRILLSHNDLAGCQYGGYMSTVGFELEDIDSNCDLCINAHIHNGAKITDKIYNIGVLTGQNFSEDASRYKHEIFIIDTDTLEIQRFENPYAYNFYKFEIQGAGDVPALRNFSFLQNSVVTVKCFASDVAEVKNILEENERIVESRVISVADPATENKNNEDKEKLLSTFDHVQKFCDFMIEKEDSKIMREELSEVIK